MRYLRMLSNSLAAAMLATCFVVTLVLQLNPTLTLHPVRLAPIVTTVGLFYVVNLTAVFYVALVVRLLLARELVSPAWLSISVLGWMAAAASLAGAGLMQTNLRAFELVLEPATVTRMSNGVLTLVMSSALFVFVALLRAHMGPPGRNVCGALLAAVWIGSVAAPIALRGPGVPLAVETRPADGTPDVGAAERPVRLVLIALDGGSLDVITGATAQGRLPNFGRMLDNGAVARLETLRPTSAEAVWAAVATGKLPQKNGVRSAATYRLPRGGDPILLLPESCFAHAMVRLGLLIEQPHSAGALRARPVWHILGALGVSVGVVGWPLTYPAPAVNGFLVSEAFHRLIAKPSGIDDASSVYPPEVQSEAFEAVESAAAAIPPALELDGLDARYQTPARIDRSSSAIVQQLSESRPPQVTMVRFQSLDPIGHYFLRYAAPTEFGDVTDEERRRYGPVLERHYALIDHAIGQAMMSLGPDDLLLVVSGFGMEPMEILKRVLEKVAGDPDLSGTHDGAPDGFLLAYGAPVARARLARGSVVDIAPTMLYFLGLPIGRDMDGQARTDLFQPSFTERQPITYIPTYDR
jgi:type I phosphodiesterase/nucleotide pyrophosphatase